MNRIKDKLVLLGCLDTFNNAPFNDTEYEIWAINTLWRKMYSAQLDRVDRWFEIHTLHTRTKEHIEWLQNYPKDIIMQDTFENIPNSIRYPLNDIITTYKSSYFLCTFSYEIALAMYLGYKEIHLYGINMIFDDDLIQRWSMEYWLGRAEQAGIKIVLPDECDLLSCGALYGYEADNTLAVYIARYMNELKNKMKNSITDSISALKEAEKAFNILENEQVKFMKEILNRHKVNYIVNNDQEVL